MAHLIDAMTDTLRVQALRCGVLTADAAAFVPGTGGDVDR